MLRDVQDLLGAWGEAVAEAIAEINGMSARRLAFICGVHPSTIGRIIKGELNPNDELKWKIAGALHKRMDQLWQWPKVIPPSPMQAA